MGNGQAHEKRFLYAIIDFQQACDHVEGYQRQPHINLSVVSHPAISQPFMCKRPGRSAPSCRLILPTHMQ
jgi:hypothetical protein